MNILTLKYTLSGKVYLKSATCTEKGWNAYVTCSRCDYSNYKEIPASGHSYGRWTCDKQATKETEGHEYRECANCHAREERVVGKLAGGCIDTGASSIITVDISLLLAAVLFAIRRKS